MENLREHLRDVLRKEVASLKRRRHGSAIIAEGKRKRHKTRSMHSKRSHRVGSAFVGEALRRHRSRHSRRHGSALLGESKKSRKSMRHSRSHKSRHSKMEGEGIFGDIAGLLGLGKHMSRRSKRSMHSRRSRSRRGSALIGLPYHAIGSAKRLHKRGRKRGNPKALLEINKMTKMYQKEGYEYKEAHKMAAADYRNAKHGSALHRSRHSRHSRKSISRRY